MKDALRLGAWFVALLIATDHLAMLGVKGLVSLRVSYMEEARLPNSFESWLASSGVESVVALLLATLFVAGGALLASCALRPRQGLLLAVALGLAFAVLRFVGSPWIAYSHAPLWFWILSMSPYYLPPLAAAAGAVLWSRIGNARVEQHAA